MNIKSFAFSLTTETIVSKAIEKFDETIGPGITDFPIKLVKKISILTPLITKMFNIFIIKKTIPVEWKSAVVTPLYKNKGNINDMNNYRGISVLPILAKLFERILAAQISIHLKIDYFMMVNMVSLHVLISDLISAKDKNLVNLLLFIDLKKAFDLVDITYYLKNWKKLASMKTRSVSYQTILWIDVKQLN
jgi:hypothetical protein